MNASFQSFSDEIIKLSARKALKLVREALGGKEMMKARRTAVRRVRRAKRRENKLLSKAEQGAPVERTVTAPKTLPAKKTRPTPPGMMVTPKGLEEANRIAQLPGALKKTTPGSQVFNLGRGGEGMATAVARPGIEGQPAIQARKLFDPKGMSSEAMIARKAQVGKAIGKDPHVAEFYGEAATPAGSKMHFSELVPAQETGRLGAPTRAVSPKPAPQKAPRTIADIPSEAIARDKALFAQAQEGTIAASRRAGFSSPQDIRRGNMVLDPRTNTYKTVDFLPARTGEFYTNPRSQSNRLAVGPGGEHLIGPMGGALATPTPKLMRQMGPGAGRRARRYGRVQRPPKRAVVPPLGPQALGKSPGVKAPAKPNTQLMTAPLRKPTSNVATL